MKDRGNHKCLSEDWLLDNLPEGWGYDCHLGGTFGSPEHKDGFIIFKRSDLPDNDGMGYPEDKVLFIPLDLLVSDRTTHPVE